LIDPGDRIFVAGIRRFGDREKFGEAAERRHLPFDIERGDPHQTDRSGQNYTGQAHAADGGRE
jgi:hypothetical protein